MVLTSIVAACVAVLAGVALIVLYEGGEDSDDDNKPEQAPEQGAQPPYVEQQPCQLGFNYAESFCMMLFLPLCICIEFIATRIARFAKVHQRRACAYICCTTLCFVFVAAVGLKALQVTADPLPQMDNWIAGYFSCEGIPEKLPLVLIICVLLMNVLLLFLHRNLPVWPFRLAQQLTDLSVCIWTVRSRRTVILLTLISSRSFEAYSSLFWLALCFPLPASWKSAAVLGLDAAEWMRSVELPLYGYVMAALIQDLDDCSPFEKFLVLQSYCALVCLGFYRLIKKLGV